jgi:hypothetical protein
MIQKSFGGILFIDEAYGLYKEDSRDYGSEVFVTVIKSFVFIFLHHNSSPGP